MNDDKIFKMKKEDKLKVLLSEKIEELKKEIVKKEEILEIINNLKKTPHYNNPFSMSSKEIENEYGKLLSIINESIDFKPLYKIEKNGSLKQKLKSLLRGVIYLFLRPFLLRVRYINEKFLRLHLLNLAHTKGLKHKIKKLEKEVEQIELESFLKDKEKIL